MVQSVEKLSRRFIFAFNPEDVLLIVGKSSVASTMQMFGQIKQDRIFEDYYMEASMDDKIFLEVTGLELATALKSCQQALEVRMKLAKKDGWPMLSLSITNSSKTGNRVYLTQDVPVRILQSDESIDLVKPVVNERKTHIFLPPIADVKTIADRMKALGSHVSVLANEAGDFVLKVQADAVSVETQFKKLGNPQPSQAVQGGTPGAAQTNRKRFVEVRVDIRDFVRFLQCSTLSPKHVVCCLVDARLLILYVYLGSEIDENDGQFVYFIPARAL
ncbi:hypothetical protein HKX48_006208 [Thoreauomyces humboldtii]|nr:hypothetical protein HKX48_006208 [Thoreauomyces humboldtii]